MFDVIGALERLGADADLAGAPAAKLGAMLQAEGADPALRTALLEGDVRVLESLLRVPQNLCPFIHTPGEQELPEKEEHDEESEDDGDDDDLDPQGPEPHGP